MPTKMLLGCAFSRLHADQQVDLTSQDNIARSALVGASRPSRRSPAISVDLKISQAGQPQ